jgi:hypothetical protein
VRKTESAETKVAPGEQCETETEAKDWIVNQVLTILKLWQGMTEEPSDVRLSSKLSGGKLDYLKIS